jgi:hypothetical protein
LLVLVTMVFWDRLDRKVLRACPEHAVRKAQPAQPGRKGKQVLLARIEPPS